MSYEGYEEHLCATGHQFEADAFAGAAYCWDDSSAPSLFCPVCGEESVWHNPVDETNYEGFPYNNYVELTAEEVCKCAECGNSHIKAEATYRVPTEKEMEKYREDRESHYDTMYTKRDT